MRLIHDGKVDGVRTVSEPEIFNVEPRMDMNKHECKRITPTEIVVNVYGVFVFGCFTVLAGVSECGATA